MDLKSSGTGHFKIGDTSGLTVDDILGNVGWMPNDQQRPARPFYRDEVDVLRSMGQIVDNGDANVLRSTLFAERLQRGNTNYNSSACTKLLTRIAGLASEYALEIKDNAGQVILKSDLEKDAALKIVALLEKLAGAEREVILKKLQAQFDAEEKTRKTERARVEREVEQMRRLEQAMDDIAAWQKRPLRLERQNGSQLHKFCDAISDGRMLAIKEGELGTMHSETGARVLRYCSQASVFVVQHDWAAAFASMIDFNPGDMTHVPLPDSCCIFEFRVSGRTVIAAVYEAPDLKGGKACSLSIATGNTFLSNFTVDDGHELHLLVDRAICARQPRLWTDADLMPPRNPTLQSWDDWQRRKKDSRRVVTAKDDPDLFDEWWEPGHSPLT